MATINTTGAGGTADRLNPTIQTTLGRLGRALTIRDGKGDQAVENAGDSVQISPAAASASSSGVGRIRAILADLESLVAQAAQDGAGADVRAEAQRRIDEAVATISQIAGSGSVGEVGSRLDSAPGYSVVNRHDSISGIAVSSELKQGERIDIDVEVVQHAHRGGLLLSFGQAAIELAAGSSFSFEFGGTLGSRKLSFASGTSILDIAAAINSSTEETGVIAGLRNNGVWVASVESSADEFVSLRVIDDGGIEHGDGIYGLDGDERTFGVILNPVLESLVGFSSSSAQDGVIDYGQSLQARLNGELVSGIQDHPGQINASLLGGRLELSLGLSPGLDLSSLSEFPSGQTIRLLTVFGGRPGPSYLSDPNDRFENIRVENRALSRGESFDVTFEVTKSAERAGVFMEPDLVFHSGTGVTSIEHPFSVMLSGAVGGVAFSFEAGSTLDSVAEEITASKASTGLQALVSGDIIRVESLLMGESQHVSLRVVDAEEDSGRAGRVSLNHHGGASMQRFQTYSLDFLESEEIELRDAGTDLELQSDGILFQADGRRVVGDALDGSLHFEFDMSYFDGVFYGLQTFGIPYGSPIGSPVDFDAFTIHGADGVTVDGPIDDIPLPSPAPVSQALSGFASTGADAGDFAGALDAIRSLRERAESGISPEALRALRRDLIAGAGELLATSTAPDAMRALDLLDGPNYSIGKP